MKLYKLSGHVLIMPSLCFFQRPRFASVLKYLFIFRESWGRAAFMNKYKDAYHDIGELDGHIKRAKDCEEEARDALKEAEKDMKI